MLRSCSLKLALVVLALWALPAVAPASEAPALSAREILDHVDDLFRGSSSHGRATMSVTTEHWTRTLSLEFWNKGKERSLLRILSPKKEKGTATLKSGTDLWNYLPKVKRVIKLPSSMMSASWMGSHFTNDDLVKDSRMAEDYDFEISSNSERDGERIVELTLIPKADAAVVWGKVVVEVRRDDYMPLGLRYYDEDLVLARTMIYSEIRELGGRTLPTRITIQPADKPAELTAVTYDEIGFDIGLSDEMFSLRTLQN